MENRPDLALEELTVADLGLSARTTNALFNNDICTAKQLQSLPISRLNQLRGLGAKCLTEIEEYQRNHRDDEDDSFYIKRTLYTPIEYLLSKKIREDAFSMLVDYYNNPSATLQSISEKYGITRERVRQIVKKETLKLRGGLLNGDLRKDFLETIEKYALEKTEIHSIELSDGPLTNVGVSRLITEAIPEKYEIFKNGHLNGLWLVHSEDNIAAVFNRLYDELHYNPMPLYIPDIVELYSINEEMIWSINGIQEKEGYVTLNSNRVSTGKDRGSKVSDYLESVGGPASISQIAEGANMTLNQVRGTVSIKNQFINVGKSIYDLADRDYSNASIEELAKKILIASDCALKPKFILEYIRKYKLVGNISVMWALNDSPDFYKHGDYYLLKDWPLDKIEIQKRESHTTTAREAILELINSSDDFYDCEIVRSKLIESGSDVTSNMSTIKATLAKLAADGKIRRIWGSNGCYMHN